jgi:superfamily II DNA helicase RecQ
MSRFVRPLLPVGSRAAQRPIASAVSEDVSELVERLRAWRLERARRDGVPAYVIFHDSTLHAIAERRPTTEPGLLAIAGFGPARLARYGAEIIELTRAVESAAIGRSE